MSAAGRWALVAGALLVLATAAAIGVYAGLYNIAADVPHTQPVYWLLETVRDRSIAARSRNIIVPDSLDMRTAYRGEQGNTRRCAAFAILRLA